MSLSDSTLTSSSFTKKGNNDGASHITFVKVSQFNVLLQFNPDSIAVISQGNPSPMATVVTAIRIRLWLVLTMVLHLISIQTENRVITQQFQLLK